MQKVVSKFNNPLLKTFEFELILHLVYMKVFFLT